MSNCTGGFYYNPALDEINGTRTYIYNQWEVQSPWAYVHFTMTGFVLLLIITFCGNRLEKMRKNLNIANWFLYWFFTGFVYCLK